MLHLALYTLADWVGMRAPPAPQRQLITATLILPQIKPPVLDDAAATSVPDPPLEPAGASPTPTFTPPTAAPALPPPPLPAPGVKPPAPAKAVAPPLPIAQPPLAIYPPEAVLRGLEGDVEISVSLDATGHILTARLERGSGHAILDDAALRAVRGIKTLPAGGVREATLPVRFRLR